MEKRVTVIAYIFAKTGEENRLRTALLQLVEQTRREKGCINYDLHESMGNKAEFVMYENWETAEDLEAHARSSHLSKFGLQLGPFLEKPTEVTKWKMISEASGL